jgi:hypothetical protein
MAFSPFTWFRKHQKVFFAGLTILCMITFIFSFGSGDLISRGLAWFGAGGDRGPLVTTLNGTKIYVRELQEVRRRREMVNEFFSSDSFRREIDEAASEIVNSISRSPQDNPLFGVRSILDERAKRGQMLANLMEWSRKMSQQEFVRRQLQLAIGDAASKTHEALRALRGMASLDGIRGDPDRLNILQRTATVLGVDLWDYTRSAGEFFLGGSSSTDSLLDFLVWKHQADKLGIHLTEADVREEVNRQAAGRDLLKAASLEKDPEVLRFLSRGGRRRQRSPADFLSALEDEFRVVLAQGLILGQEPGARFYRTLLGAYDSPAVFSPDEFLQFYRRQRTTQRVQLLPVPAADFVKEVKEQPSEDSLRLRYDKYKDQEPDPSRRTPGFKEPRRIAVEFVHAGPDDPYYREHGRKMADTLTRLSATPRGVVGQLFAIPIATPGTGALGGAAGVGVFFAPPVDPLGQEYQKYAEKMPSWYKQDEDLLPSGLPDAATHRWRNVVLTVGALAGSVQGMGGPLAAPATWYGYGWRRNVRDAVRYNASLLLAGGGAIAQGGAQPQVSPFASALTAAALASSFRPVPLPLNEVRDRLLADLQRRYADDLVRKDIDAFETELAKHRSPKAARDFLAGAIKKYHLRRGGMDRPRGALALLDALRRKTDVGLEPLRRALAPENPDYRPEELVNQLFGQTAVYSPNRPFQPSAEGESYVWWLTENLPAEPRSFKQVRDQVVEAWRLEKARQRARRAAERIDADLKAKKYGPADAERFLRDRAGAGQDLIELTGVARLVRAKEVRPVPRAEYQEYTVPTSLRDRLPYPPKDLAGELMKLKEPGASQVIHDEPANTYYVAVLVNRDEPSVKQFEAMYKRQDNQLLQMFLNERARDYYKMTIEQLRREAVPKPDTMIDKDGTYVISDDARRYLKERSEED